jgi:MtN3 and saliva related transmembrane protein
MTSVEILGAAAAVMSTAAFFPQALRVIATRDTRAISLPMYLMLVAGILLWGSYGLITQQWSILAANGVTFVPAIIILVMKTREVLRARASGA